jgi:hypothetical protein
LISTTTPQQERTMEPKENAVAAKRVEEIIDELREMLEA